MTAASDLSLMLGLPNLVYFPTPLTPLTSVEMTGGSGLSCRAVDRPTALGIPW